MYCYSDLAKDGIHCELDSEIKAHDSFDAYIVQRVVHQPGRDFFKQEKTRGKKIVWSLDDDIWNLKQGYPLEEWFKQQLPAINEMKEFADYIWVSTPHLAKVVSKPEVTRVLPNLIDYPAFPQNIERQSNFKTRIAWWGSMFHEFDLRLLVDPIYRILGEFKGSVEFLWFGDMPDDFSCFHRLANRNELAITTVRPELRHCMVYHQRVDHRDYHHVLGRIKPDISLCVLEDSHFNKSKSALKLLEALAIGSRVLCSDIEPYQGILNHNVRLTSNDRWYESLRDMLREPRDHKLEQAGFENFRRAHCWNENTKQVWLNAFREIFK